MGRFGFEGVGMYGSTEAPKIPDAQLQEQLDTVIGDEETAPEVKNFLSELTKNGNVETLDRELNMLGEGIGSLSIAPGEIVPILKNLMAETDPETKKALTKKIENMLN